MALKNLALSVAIGVLLAVSPLTPDDSWKRIGSGALAALAFFVYRSRTASQASDVFWDGRRRIEALRVRDVQPLVWVALGLFVVMFLPTFRWMFREWTTSVWSNNHGIFMPVLMFLLARSVLRKHESVEDDSSPWGLVWIAVAVSMLLVDSVAQTRYLSGLALVVALPGLSLLFFGIERTRALRFVLLLGIFMIPIPIGLSNHLVLRNATAAGTVPILRAMGIPVAREYSVLDLADAVFIVTDACSGFATLYSAAAFTIFLAVYCSSTLRRAALLLCFFPLALGANILRVLALILIGKYGGLSLLDTALHEASGVASFVLVLGVLFWLADREALRRAFA